MRKYTYLTLLAILASLPSSHLLLQGCGNTSVELEGESSGGGSSEASESACDDTGDDVVVDPMTASVSGEACNTPTPSDNGTTIILDCTDPDARDTDADISDFTTITDCGADSGIYYCADGVVYKDDGGDGEELFGQVEISCEGDTGSEALVEDELIIG